MKPRSLEIRERAMAILGVSSIYDTDAIRRNFHRQIRLVNPNGPHRREHVIPGFPNSEVARLLIQSYCYLIGRTCPTTVIEDDALVGTLLDGDITPIRETSVQAEWRAEQFYDQFRNSIWPHSPQFERERKQKFGGIC